MSAFHSFDAFTNTHKIEILIKVFFLCFLFFFIAIRKYF